MAADSTCLDITFWVNTWPRVSPPHSPTSNDADPDKCPCYTNVRVWSSAKAETVYHHKPCALGTL